MKFSLLIALVAVVFAVGLRTNYTLSENKEWHRYKAKYDKKYPDATSDAAHKEAFFKKKQIIAEHNARYDRGEESYFLGVNQFTDLLPGERIQNLALDSSEIRKIAYYKDVFDDFPELANYTEPDSLDWRKKGAVTPAKNQFKCNSCWIFAAVSTIESQVAIHTGKLRNLSEQNIVDCIGRDGCAFGGKKDIAMKYVIRNGGIESEENYPFIHNHSDKCLYNKKYNAGKISKIRYIRPHNATLIKKVIAYYGPTATSINSTVLVDYSGGIIDTSCNSNATDHAVVLVGYGTENGEKYWIGKNSWGSHWGENGFFRIKRGVNLCNIEQWQVLAVY